MTITTMITMTSNTTKNTNIKNNNKTKNPINNSNKNKDKDKKSSAIRPSRKQAKWNAPSKQVSRRRSSQVILQGRDGNSVQDPCNFKENFISAQHFRQIIIIGRRASFLPTFSFLRSSFFFLLLRLLWCLLSFELSFNSSLSPSPLPQSLLFVLFLLFLFLYFLSSCLSCSCYCFWSSFLSSSSSAVVSENIKKQ